MADFSKQYCELHLQDFPGDFDILEIAKQIPEDEYMPYICEGYGFIAIGKDIKGNVTLAVPIDGEDKIIWKPYAEVIV